jgi:hypothetical protein
MQTVLDLLDKPESLRFLESEGVFITQKDFKDQLEKPVNPFLADQLGIDIENRKLVCSGQQIYVDYQQSVLSKIEILQGLEQDQDLFAFFLWVDTDRSGSDKLITKFAWPASSKKGPVTILPPGTRDIESRFVTVDSSQLMSAIDKLETHLRQSGVTISGAKERYQQLREIFENGNSDTLSKFNLRLTDFLLTEVLDYVPPAVILSEWLDKQVILDEVNLFVNRVADVVKVFNEAVLSLVQKEIDPQVKPLDEHYLPLFISCESDNKRLRLYHHIDGNDHFAVTACKCGQEYRFHLGHSRLSINEIARTGQWSPDVCFPIFFNDLVSGYVAGKSSTVYLMVMNEVLRKVLNKTPVPILIPNNLVPNEKQSVQTDSLIYRYLADEYSS